MKVTVKDYIAVVELANPPVNAMSLKLQAEITADLGKCEASKKAMRAFVEKRSPVFKGR